MKDLSNKNSGKDNNLNIEIDVVPLLLELMKKMWLILIFGLVFAIIAFSGVKIFIHPTYKCNFTAYVNNYHAQTDKDYLSSSDITAAKELVQTYSKILTSNTILNAAAKSMDSKYDAKQLAKMVGTEILDQTEIIRIYVIAKSPQEAYKIASVIASVAPAYMADIVEGSSMKIVDYPQMPDEIYKPNYNRYTMLGAVFGMLLIVALLVIRYFLNDTITDENELEKRFSYPIIGLIPDVNSAIINKSSYYYYKYESNGKGEKK